MSASAEQYRDQIMRLQPPGAALPGDADSTWAKLWLALAEELARVEARGEQLLREADPRQTVELLADWAQAVGLPDDCVVGEQTSDQRRAVGVTRLAPGGNLSRRYLIDTAARLGYGITITEFLPHSVDSDVDSPLFNEDWVFVIQINAPAVTVYEATVDSDVDAPLAWWGNNQLECTMARHKPGGRILRFAYS